MLQVSTARSIFKPHPRDGNGACLRQKNSPEPEVNDAETQEHVDAPLSGGSVHGRSHFVQRPCTVTQSAHAFLSRVADFLTPPDARMPFVPHNIKLEVHGNLRPSQIHGWRQVRDAEEDPKGVPELQNETSERVRIER